jgi:hypothetical protein
MGRMTTRWSQILWFLVIYGLSVSTFILLALLTRMLVRATWER